MKQCFNFFICLQFFLQALLIHQVVLSKSSTSVVDEGNHLLICSQEPIDFGIVLDSSVSIRDPQFITAKKFLVHFLDQFDIGSGPNDVRVSIITFGLGIYPKDAFNLDTYPDKEGVLKAISEIPHRAGPRTDTGLAIRYMHRHQLSNDKVRPNAEKISLVITDGNSQRWTLTKREALRARNDNITMFALGVGTERDVKMKELRNIAGSLDRVTRVDNFDSLESIKEILAKKTCVRSAKPTTTPPPMIQSCGEANPADIQFFFSPSDLGLDATAWTTSFISNTLKAEDMEVGFRYGARTGSCPSDAGFHLDAYDTMDAIMEHVSAYDKLKLPSLISMEAFDEAHGGRETAKDIAVIFFTGGKATRDIQSKVDELLEKEVEVYMANPAGYPVRIKGAKPLMGRSSRQQSEMFINYLCPE